jgi:hypothetical protein
MVYPIYVYCLNPYAEAEEMMQVEMEAVKVIPWASEEVAKSHPVVSSVAWEEEADV